MKLRVKLLFIGLIFNTAISHADMRHSHDDEPDKTKLVDIKEDSSDSEILESGISYRDWVSQSFRLARALAKNAYNNTPHAVNRSYFWKMSYADPQLHWPNSGQDFNGCKSTTLAFVVRNNRNNIYICAKALRRSQNYLAQTLVHELAHVVDLFNECDATYLEREAMNLSSIAIQYNNGYVDRCY